MVIKPVIVIVGLEFGQAYYDVASSTLATTPPRGLKNIHCSVGEMGLHVFKLYTDDIFY